MGSLCGESFASLRHPPRETKGLEAVILIGAKLSVEFNEAGAKAEKFPHNIPYIAKIDFI